MDIKFEKVPRPISNRLLVIPDIYESVTASGIFLMNKRKPTTGVVLSVGQHSYDYDILGFLRPGVKVLFGDWAGVEFVHEKVKIYSMRTNDIFAIID